MEVVSTVQSRLAAKQNGKDNKNNRTSQLSVSLSRLSRPWLFVAAEDSVKRVTILNKSAVSGYRMLIRCLSSCDCHNFVYILSALLLFCRCSPVYWRASFKSVEEIMGVCTNPVKVLDFAFHAFPTLCPTRPQSCS